MNAQSWTGFTTGWMFVHTMQRVVESRLSSRTSGWQWSNNRLDNQLNVCIHDAAGCPTSCQTWDDLTQDVLTMEERFDWGRYDFRTFRRRDVLKVGRFDCKAVSDPGTKKMQLRELNIFGDRPILEGRGGSATLTPKRCSSTSWTFLANPFWRVGGRGSRTPKPKLSRILSWF